MNPIVSIVIPVHNTKRYLRQCLSSVLDQTMSRFEVICVDDGSTDGSADILREYAEADLRMKVITQNKQGAGVARNVGIAVSKGKYLYFLDSDDYIDSCLLEETVNNAEETEADIVSFDFNIYDEVSGVTAKADWADGDKYINSVPFSYKTNAKYIFQYGLTVAWRKLYRRKFITENNIVFQAVWHSNDTYFVLIASAKAKIISHIDKRLITYRTGNNNSLHADHARSPADLPYIYREIHNELRNMRIYETVEQSFLNYVLVSCLYILDMIESYDLFFSYYERLKNDVLLYFGMTQKSDDYYYNGSSSKSLRLFMEGPEKYLMQSKANCRKKMRSHYYKFQSKIWPFPFYAIRHSSRVILYGAGDVGQDYYRQATQSGYCDIVLWVDRDYAIYQDKCLPVSAPDKIETATYDHILISVLRQDIADEIKKILCEYGVPDEKIMQL